jgi:hypothetical protein
VVLIASVQKESETLYSSSIDLAISIKVLFSSQLHHFAPVYM